MKSVHILSLAIANLIISCSCTQEDQSTKKNKTESNHTVNIQVGDSVRNKEEIEMLIKNVLKWADSKQVIPLLPAIVKDSICIGFNLDALEKNLIRLEGTGFFASEFIQNYNKIILTLNQKIKNNEFAKWNVYELPSFRFANGFNPWCECQDNLDWNLVEVKIMNNDNGKMIWHWGSLGKNYDESWKKFEYRFRVVKEDGKWKIAFMQGFDFKESTTKYKEEK
jgi:hypothetical protein